MMTVELELSSMLDICDFHLSSLLFDIERHEKQTHFSELECAHVLYTFMYVYLHWNPKLNRIDLINSLQFHMMCDAFCCSV